MQNIKLDQQLKIFLNAYQNKEFDKAEQIAIDLTKSFQKHPFGWKARSMLSNIKGDFEEALVFIQKSIDLLSEDPESHYNKGSLLLKIDRYKDAIYSFNNAIDKKKDYFQAYFNIGHANEKLNNLDNAIKNYKQAISINKKFVKAYYNLGTILIKTGKLQEAEKMFKQVLLLKNSDERVFNNLGYINEKMGKLDEAEKNYKTASQINSNFSDAFYNLGNVLKKKNKIDEADYNFKKAIQINPKFADAYKNLGNSYFEKKEFIEAIRLYKEAINIKKNFPSVENLLIGSEKTVCNFDISRNIDKLTKNLGLTTKAIDPFFSLSWIDDPDLQLKRAKKFTDENFNSKKKLPISTKNKLDKIRVAYFCSDFHDFPTMHLLIRQLEIHNRNDFEVYAFSYGLLRNDEMNKRIMLAVDEFVDIKDLTVEEITKIIHEKKIDISIDLNGFTKNSKTEIFQNRISPIQINYLGYPGTMGADFMDYIVADPVLINSEYRKFYSEKVIYMPNTYQPNDNLRKIDKKNSKRSDYNLPDNAFVLCCFNQSYKISHLEFNIWLKILKKIPNSVLWLFKHNKWAEQNLIKEITKYGLDPSRLIFADRTTNSEHLARHKHADLFIDTFNYNAHTTASDALYAGLPIVTKMGKQFSARVCASLLNAVGLPELVVNTEEEYEKLILDLASDNEKLKKIKSKLLSNKDKSPLFDSETYTKNFEQALKEVFELYLKNKPTQDIWIN